MDEYSILRKKTKKNAFAATALLISIAIALLFMVGAVLVLGKVSNNDLVAANDSSSATNNTSSQGQACNGLVKEVIFNNNLRDIKDAAVSYFTNERLPQKVGDKVTISLKQMKDKKLIIAVVDSTGKACSDDKTYVEVTKEQNEYVMKIFLSCSDMEDYILVHLGCYDYCKDNVCEKQDENGVTEFEYEYRKTVSCVMSKWSDWGAWKTTREKTSNLKKEDIKVVTKMVSTTDTKDAIKDPDTYTCANYEGYKLVGDKCVKETTRTDVLDAEPSDYSYSCANYEGYKVVGSKCVKKTTVTDTIDAEKNPTTYSCPEGYTLTDNNKCERTVKAEEIINATKEATTYTCPKGYTRDAITYTVKSGDTLDAIAKTYNIALATLKKVNNITGSTVAAGTKLSIPVIYQTKCYKMVDKKDTKDATITCPDGYDKSGTTCTLKKNATVTCPSGYEKSGTTCTLKKNATVTCPSGYDRNGTQCIKTINATPVYGTHTCKKQDCTTKPQWTCDSNGENCGMKDITSCTTYTDTCPDDTPSSYTCPSGYTKSGTKCKLTKNATVTCPSGYTKSGTTCTLKKDATVTCPSGYTKSGTTCTLKKNATVTCPKNYTLSGTTCTKTYQEKEEVNANANQVVYSCKDGYSLTDDNKCTREVDKLETIDGNPDPDTYSCKEGYKLTEDNKCTKDITVTDTKNAEKVEGGYVCKEGYELTEDNKCQKEVTEKDTKNADKNDNTYTCIIGYELTEDNKCTKTTEEEVKTTYYRYATRKCTGGSTDTKWSTSKNDSILLNEGYKLTGNKRAITVTEK